MELDRSKIYTFSDKREREGDMIESGLID
jgi:hypothetical protein